jgi:hypothetical protein
MDYKCCRYTMPLIRHITLTLLKNITDFEFSIVIISRTVSAGDISFG